MAGLRGENAGFYTEPDKFSNRRDDKFLHDATAVDLHGFLGDIQFDRGLFVLHAGNHISHDLVLAGRQRFDAVSDGVVFGLSRTVFRISG